MIGLSVAERLEAARRVNYETALCVPVGYLAVGVGLDRTAPDGPIVFEVVRVDVPGFGRFADDDAAQRLRIIGEGCIVRAFPSDLWAPFAEARANGQFPWIAASTVLNR